MVELTKLETLAVSGGGECYCKYKSFNRGNIYDAYDYEITIERGDMGDVGPTTCGISCCGTLGMSAGRVCIGWIYNGTNFEVPITTSSAGEILMNTEEVKGRC
jgi:hypothetical protein